MEGGSIGHKFERDPPWQVWFNLVQRFQGRRFKCDLLSKYAKFFAEFSIFGNGNHLGWRGGIVGHTSERDPPKEHSITV